MRNLEALTLYGRARAVEATILPPLPVSDATASSDMRAAVPSQEGMLWVEEQGEESERNSAIEQIVADWAEEPIVI